MDTKILSPMKNLALAIVDNTARKLKEQILTECTDDEITQNMARMHPDLRGTYREEDYVSYDKALKRLGMKHNRNKLSALAKQYGIKNHTFNNAHIGFHKDDIAKLKCILNEEKLKKK